MGKDRIRVQVLLIAKDIDSLSDGTIQIVFLRPEVIGEIGATLTGNADLPAGFFGNVDVVSSA